MSRQKRASKRDIKKRRCGNTSYHKAVISDTSAPYSTYGLPSGGKRLHWDGGSTKIVSVLTALVRTLTHTISVCVLIGRTSAELKQLRGALRRRRAPSLRELD